MNKEEAKKRIETLREEINYHRYLYHVRDTQEISDGALDSLKNELVKLEEEFPELITPDSPTQRVGGQALEEFTQVEHSTRMLSLQDYFSLEELKKWEERNQKIVPEKYEYFAQLKIDGVAVALIYKDGVLEKAATRGDGFIGEDVTQNIKTIEAIPLTLQKKVPGTVEVRGEVYMLKKDFESMNAQREKKGLPLFANPRNVSAGSIRQLDPAITRARPLRFFAWEITQGVQCDTREQEYQELAELGFLAPPDSGVYATIDDAWQYIQKEEKKRLTRVFQVDGLVLKINSIATAKRLGVVGKAPRASAAFKFPAEEATTIIEEIAVQVGRTGALTPVAHLAPVTVAGTTVSRATLHNQDEISRKDIRVGDTVVIHKAGDIIPEVVKVLTRLRPKNTKPFIMPTVCPICGSKVATDTDGVVVRCKNKQCFSQQRERILYAVSKASFDIDGLGEKIVEQLLQEGLISDVPDIWELKIGDVLELEGFAEKSANNLIQEIASKKNITLSRFLLALSIPQVGAVTAQDLSRHFGSLDAISKASPEELTSLEGIGQKVAEGIHHFFNSKEGKDTLEKFTHVGITITKEAKGGSLSGKTFVFTGGLPDMTRNEAKQIVISLGARVVSTVGKEVDYVVAGEDAGSKISKAKELGLLILTPEQFNAIIQQ